MQLHFFQKQLLLAVLLCGGLTPQAVAIADELSVTARVQLQVASKLHHDGRFAEALQAVRTIPSGERNQSEAAVTIHGECLLKLREPLAATTVLEDAVERFPNSPRCRAQLGAARWLCGKSCAGMDDLSQAVSMRSDDKISSVNGVVTPSDESIRHGEEQISAMLRDLPIMDDSTAVDGWLRDWCVRQFAGESTGFEIDWSPKRPTFADAAHSRPENGLRATIKLSPVRVGSRPVGQPFSSEEIWSKLVFEFHNIQNTGDGELLNQRAMRGGIGRTDYVMKSLEMELKAIERTRAFYVRQYLPHAFATCATTDPRVWYLDRWDTIANYKVRSANPKGYPFLPFGSHYDWIRVRGHQAEGQHDEAIGLLRQMSRYAERDETGVSIWSALSNACYAAGRNQEGVDAADDGLKNHPQSIHLLRVRAYGLVQLGDVATAEKVVAEILRIDATDEYALQVRQAINTATQGHSGTN